MLSTFAPRTRSDAQKALIGFGDSFAGRGNQINDTIRELRPFLVHLGPVMRNLSSPKSELRNLVPALAAAAAQVAPVAEVQAQLFGDLADTFAAINRDPRALQETIEETPPTLAAATASFRVQTPFLARFADVSRRLGPGAAELRRSLPLINDALSAGVPAFRRTPELGERLAQLLDALATLSENPNTLLSLRDLRRALQVSRPAIEHIAPYQTVCNYLVYFFNPLGTHLSETVPGGTQERIKAKLADLTPGEHAGPDRVAAAGGRAQQPGPAVRRAPGAAHAVRRPGDRQEGQRRLPERADRLPQPAGDRPALAARLVRGRASSAAAATWSSTGTRPAWPAGPTGRASSASTT